MSRILEFQRYGGNCDPNNAFYVVLASSSDGKRYLSDNEAGDLKQGLEARYATLKGKRETRFGLCLEDLCKIGVNIKSKISQVQKN